MARTARKRSESGIYHAMARGVNRQPLFEEEADSRKFMEILGDCKDLGGFELFAYCLMGNHFHLLIRASENEPLETVFRRIGSRYVGWFNRKYDRMGHLFQDRFASEPVEDDAYLLSCVRYILMNPVVAGLVRSPQDYAFSSMGEYLGKVSGPTDTSLVLDMVGAQDFVEFVTETTEGGHLDVDGVHRATDAEIRRVMESVSGCADASAIQKLDKARRDTTIAAMRAAGGSIRQVCRLTGVGAGVVRRFPGTR